MTPAVIEPATFQFIAQHFNHCATASPPKIYSGLPILRHSPVVLQKLDVALWTTIWLTLITTDCVSTPSALPPLPISHEEDTHALSHSVFYQASWSILKPESDITHKTSCNWA